MRPVFWRALFCSSFALTLSTVPSWANLSVSTPTTGSQVTSPVLFTAKSTTSCSKGVSTMGIDVDSKLVYRVKGSNLYKQLALSAGNHNITIHEWDHCGDSSQSKQTLTIVTAKAPPASKVVVTQPANNSLAVSPVNFVATATAPSCAAGVASVGVYKGSQLLASQSGSSLNTELNFGVGPQSTTVTATDNCGKTTSVPVKLTVQGAPNVLSNLQSSPGWESHGQLPPHYADCSPCDGINWSLEQNVATPSLSGQAAEFDTSGSKPYSVVLWVNPVIGAYSTQGLPDKAKTLVPSLHNFTYDADFYVTNAPYTHALEFDVAMYMSGIGMFFGTQCAQGGDGDWDILDKGGKDWVNSGVPCNYVDGWNHLTLQFQRLTNNHLLYKSITLNGIVYPINVSYPPQAVSSSWYGVTVNYQMDGDKYQDTNTTYLDNLSLTYW